LPASWTMISRSPRPTESASRRSAGRAARQRHANPRAPANPRHTTGSCRRKKSFTAGTQEARLIRAPEDPAAAQTPRRISLGRVNGRRFVFAAGIGVDSDAVRELDTIQRGRDGRRPGDLAYARVVARRLLSGYEQRLELEGLGRAALVFVSNHAVFSYAGPVPLRFSPEARFELGLDVAAPERAGRVTALRLAGRLSVGRGIAGAPGVLTMHDVDRVVVRCDKPLPLQADGEDLGDVTEAVFEAERNAIDVLV